MAKLLVFYDGPIVTRAEAVKEGTDRYFIAKPCRYGHIAQRFVAGGCAQCQTILRRQNDKQVTKRRDKLLEEIAGRPKPKKCEVCGKIGRRILFDHCQTSMKFRGWLCDGCNMSIGLVHESPQRLRALAAYLEKNAPSLDYEEPKFRIGKRGFIIPNGLWNGKTNRKKEECSS